MLHVAICDDEENEIEYLKYAVEDWAKKEDIITNIETYASAESFLFQYEECKNYQILLLDVEMSGMSGIDLAKKIRQNQDNVEIIFITLHFEFIGVGYEVDALHYLVKPVKAGKMEEVLSKAKCKIEAGEPSIIIHYEGEVVKLYEKEILYLESLSHCNGVQREHNKKLNNGLPILHKVPPKRDYGRYFCIMAEKGGTSHGGLTEKLSLFFHAKKQEVNAYGR